MQYYKKSNHKRCFELRKYFKNSIDIDFLPKVLAIVIGHDVILILKHPYYINKRRIKGHCDNNAHSTITLHPHIVRVEIRFVDSTHIHFNTEAIK